MKKLIAMLLTAVLMLALAGPASAATTMNWDWGKARVSIGKAAGEMVREEQAIIEPVNQGEQYLWQKVWSRYLEWWK